MLTGPKRLTFDIPNVNPPGTHRVTCYQWGNDDAPRTILCVHGLTRNGRDFDFLAQALGDGYRVLCPDIAGRGTSEWRNNPLEYNNPAYIADLGFILHALGLTQVDWIGTSMGGILALMMANAAPGLIRCLVLNDVGCIIPAAGLQRIKNIANIQTVFENRTDAEASFRKRTASFSIQDETHWQHLLAYGIEDTPDGKARFTYDPGIFAVGFPKDAPVTDIDLWPLWEAVTTIPMLLIRGAESDILTRETAQLMQARHPSLTLKEIPGCGHAPALMDNGQIAMIKEWLATHPEDL